MKRGKAMATSDTCPGQCWLLSCRFGRALCAKDKPEQQHSQLT